MIQTLIIMFFWGDAKQVIEVKLGLELPKKARTASFLGASLMVGSQTGPSTPANSNASGVTTNQRFALSCRASLHMGPLFT